MWHNTMWHNLKYCNLYHYRGNNSVPNVGSLLTIKLIRDLVIVDIVTKFGLDFFEVVVARVLYIYLKQTNCRRCPSNIPTSLTIALCAQVYLKWMKLFKCTY